VAWERVKVKDSELFAAPVIIFSGRGTQDVVEKVINAGANEFLSKMLTSPSKLADTVKMVLQQSHRTD
jgi:DNA-binding NarL/FixJ family response regulator